MASNGQLRTASVSVEGLGLVQMHELSAQDAENCVAEITKAEAVSDDAAFDCIKKWVVRLLKRQVWYQGRSKSPNG